VDIRRHQVRLSNARGRWGRGEVLRARTRSADRRQQTQNDVRRVVNITRVPRAGRRTRLLQLLPYLFLEAVQSYGVTPLSVFFFTETFLYTRKSCTCVLSETESHHSTSLHTEYNSIRDGSAVLFQADCYELILSKTGCKTVLTLKKLLSSSSTFSHYRYYAEAA